MNYIVTTKKNVEQALESLRETVAEQQFGVLHVHNLKQKMNDNGIEFDNECQVVEVCNPHRAKSVLDVDMALNMALPCRISIYEEDGETKIGMLNPSELLGVLSSNGELKEIAVQVEQALKIAIDKAAA